MTSRLRPGGVLRACAVLAATLAAGSADVASQTPAGAPAQTPHPTGLILGRVIDATTNAPVTGAIVTLSGGSMNRPARVIVDGQGRFVFGGLPRDAYEMAATRAGYLPGSYGRLRPDGAGRSLILPDNDRITDVVIRLWKFAAINGTVTDDAGDPVPGARVQALKRTIVAGRWRLVNSNIGGNADERGVYRIVGLMPGEYALVITSLTSTLPMSLLQVADAAKRMTPQDASIALRELNTNGTGGYANDLSQGFPTTRVGDLLLQSSGNALLGADGRTVESYATVWYPSAATPADASLVTLGAGENRTGIDLHPTLRKALRLSGTVTGPDGPVPHLALRLVPAQLDDAAAEITSSLSLSLTTAMSATDVNGAFTFLAVPPGQYIIRAVTSPRPAPEPPRTGGPAPPPLVSTDPTWWTATPVSVGDSDTTGVVVAMRRGIRVTGRVEFVGTSPAIRPPLRFLKVRMDPADGRTVAYPEAYQAQIDESGRFYTIGLMAGRYVLRIDGLGPGGGGGDWGVKSAMVNGVDICDVPLALANDDVDGLVITLTTQHSRVSGVVRSTDGRPDENATILIFPANGVWTDLGSSPRRLRAVRASPRGEFGFDGLPAGDYQAIAVNDAVAGNWQEPAFLQKLARLATRVTVGDGQAVSLTLTTTPGIVR